uniref:sorting nexin-10B-like isoform X2 n=1 Tax=Myxine glutinosa TaxID=7769 RepID=UPI00358E1700
MDAYVNEFIEVRIGGLKIRCKNSWHPYVDYEIFVHTNSISFSLKSSCVQRRFREFVWLRKWLEKSAAEMEVPELPARNPFFSCFNPEDVEQRRRGLQEFLDRRLHLFLQSRLSTDEIEACVQGRTSFSVRDAILKSSQTARRSSCADTMKQLPPKDELIGKQVDEEHADVLNMTPDSEGFWCWGQKEEDGESK